MKWSEFFEQIQEWMLEDNFMYDLADEQSQSYIKSKFKLYWEKGLSPEEAYSKYFD